MKKRRGRDDSSRFVVLLLLLALSFTAVAVRLVFLQVVNAEALEGRARAQRLRDIQVPPKRGTIYDREGEELATTVDAKTVYAAPNQVKDKAGTAKAIARVLGGDVAEYQAKLERDSGFVYIARKVDVERAEALKDLELPGVGLLDDSRRVYPSGELACQVLGFVGVDDVGLAGVEQGYNELLAGKPGALLAERDPYGRPIPGGVLKETAPVHGSGIVLTIDKDIQYEAQTALVAAVKKWKAKSGTIVVMNPKTGEIYAMASTPGFNPNAYGKAKPDAWRNRALTDTYEPGSTIKSLTAAAVIDKGLFTPTSKFVLPPTLRVGGRTIHESHGRGTVTWTLTDIVTNSSNVGAVKLGQALGAQGLYKSFDAFGLTGSTGVDFPGETPGWLPPVSQWSASSIGNIPFGQGVSVNALQLSRAIGAIANDGVLVTPHFLLAVPDDPDAVPVWKTARAISPKAARQTSTLMESVVTEGTGKDAAVPGYTVAGKTGTAQKAANGGYAGGKYIGSFIGFLPTEDPQVLVNVLLDEPSGAIYGGVVAAPTFSKVAQFAVSHLAIPPSSSKVGGSATETTKTP